MTRTIFTEDSGFYKNRNALEKIKPYNKLYLFYCDIFRFAIPYWRNISKLSYENDIIENVQNIEDFSYNLIDIRVLRDSVDRINWFSDLPKCVVNLCYAISNFYTGNYCYFNVCNCCSYYLLDLKNYLQWDFVYNLYLQTFKPKHIIIPKKPLFIEIANEIKNTRNFELYNILTDAILDYSNIKINTKCLGISNWLLFHFLTKD